MSKQSFLSIALVVVGFAVVFGLSRFLEANRSASHVEYEDEDLILQGARLKNYTLGFDGLLADWYWMKSLQYIGIKLLNSQEDLNLDNLNPLNPRLLYPYLDNATTLDARFLAAYQYGAVVLPAIDNDQAIRLVEKGIENNSHEWRLYHNLGFIYWRMKDYERASEIYESGSAIAGAPPFMRLMAAKMKSEGGSRRTAREIYGQMLEQTTDEQTKKTVNARLLELDSLDERDAVNEALGNFKAKNNRCAADWREVTAVLRNVKSSANVKFRVDETGVLVDPSDTPYVLDTENCQIKLNEERTKVPIR